MISEVRWVPELTVGSHLSTVPRSFFLTLKYHNATCIWSRKESLILHEIQGNSYVYLVTPCHSRQKCLNSEDKSRSRPHRTPGRNQNQGILTPRPGRTPITDPAHWDSRPGCAPQQRQQGGSLGVPQRPSGQDAAFPP